MGCPQAFDKGYLGVEKGVQGAQGDQEQGCSNTLKRSFDQSSLSLALW